MHPKTSARKKCCDLLNSAVNTCSVAADRCCNLVAIIAIEPENLAKVLRHPFRRLAAFMLSNDARSIDLAGGQRWVELQKAEYGKLF